MATSMATLVTRLEKKNIAIAKQASKVMKHSRRYLKNKATKSAEEMEYDYSFSDMKDSAKNLKYLLKDRKEILKLMEEVKKNEVILPKILDDYRNNLEASFIADRFSIREYLKETWENEYKPLIGKVSHDIFNKFMNSNYRRLFGYSTNTYTNYITEENKKMIKEEDLADLEIFLNGEKGAAFKHLNWDKITESDESIKRRSAKAAKELVEDLYTRTFGFTGKVEDYSGLHISIDNRGYSIINGIINGEKGSCKVESISAGGYNIQCWHIRVLVKAI